MANLPTEKTNNPPGSTAPVDMRYNSALLDCLLNSDGEFEGRLGKILTSWSRAISRLGYTIVGEFGQTFQIAERTQVVLDSSDGNVYQWTLGLPKNVTPSDSPTDPGWSVVSDAALRSQLTANGGNSLVSDSAFFSPSIELLQSASWINSSNVGDLFLVGGSTATVWEVTTETTSTPLQNGLFAENVPIASGGGGGGNDFLALADLIAANLQVDDVARVVTDYSEEVFIIRDAIPSDPRTAYYQIANNNYAVKLGTINGTPGLIDSQNVFFGLADQGVHSWWSSVAAARYEGGQKILYVGGVKRDGTQIVTRCNLGTNERVERVVHRGFAPDDHNAPGVGFTRNGKIVVACTGHNDPVTGDPATGGEYLHWDVFNTWGDVGLLQQNFAFSATLTYVQIVTLFNWTMILTRRGNDFWSHIISTDQGATWTKPGDPWPDSSDNLFKGDFLEANDQIYVLGVEVDRSLSSQPEFENADRQIRLIIGYNASSSTAPDANVRRAAFRYDPADGSYNFVIGTNVERIGTGRESISLADVVYEPAANKSVRIMDVAGTDGRDDFACLICEADGDRSTGLSNYQYKLLIGGSDAVVVDVPIPVGEPLDWYMYVPGGCFVKRYAPDALGGDRYIMYFATNNNDQNGIYELYRAEYRGAVWYIDLVQRLPSGIGRLGRLVPVGGSPAGLADVVMSRFTRFGNNDGTVDPNNPAFEDYQGSMQVVTNNENPHVPGYWSEISTGRRYVIHPNGDVDMYSDETGAGTSGVLDLPVALQCINSVSYDDNATGGGQNISTSGTYGSYLPPVRAINWESDATVSGFSWHVKGKILTQPGFPAYPLSFDRSFSVGASPSGSTTNNSGQIVICRRAGSDNIEVRDISNGGLVSTHTIGGSPECIAFNGTNYFVGYMASNQINVYDTSFNLIDTFNATGSASSGITSDASTGNVFVQPFQTQAQVYEFQPDGTAVGSGLTFNDARSVNAVERVSGAFLVLFSDENVTRFDDSGNSLGSEFDIRAGSSGTSLSSMGNTYFVTRFDNDTVDVFN